MRLLIIALCLIPIAYSQTIAVSINMSGSGSEQIVSAETGTLNSNATGTVNPFGTAAVTLSVTSNEAQGTATGTYSFSIPGSGSFNLSFSQPYNGSFNVETSGPISGGTGIFSSATGTLNVTYNGVLRTLSSGTFTLTGTGTLSGVMSVSGTPLDLYDATSAKPSGTDSIATHGPLAVSFSTGSAAVNLTDVSALISNGGPLVLNLFSPDARALAGQLAAERRSIARPAAGTPGLFPPPSSGTAVALFSDVSSPSALIQDIGTLPDTALPPSGDVAFFDFPVTPPVLLNPNTQYWIVFAAASASPAGLVWTTNTSGPGVASQFLLYDGAVDRNNGDAYQVQITAQTPAPPPPPAPTITSFYNGASFATGATVSAGSLATLFGTGFGVQTSPTGSSLPTVLASTSVTVNMVPAPLDFVNPTQINFEVPLETADGPATAIVTSNGVPSAAFTFQVAPAAPGIFLYDTTRAIAQNLPSYSLNGPTNPASPGDYLVVYLTGQGPVSGPALKDGIEVPAPPPLYTAKLPHSATVDGKDANVAFLGLASGFVGLAQADVQVPAGLKTGDYPLVITVNGVKSNTATVSVK